MRLLPPSRTAHAVFCALVIILSACFAAHAQQPMPIYVTFKWPLDIPPEDQREINKAILDILGEEFHFWAFRENEGNHFPQLAISARKGTRWLLLMDFRTASDWRKEWSVTLYAEGELARQGNPARGQWEPKISDVFRNVLINPEFDEIREKFLSHVAISQRVLRVPNLPETLALLPLSWKVFNSLAMSEFKIQSGLAMASCYCIRTEKGHARRALIRHHSSESSLSTSYGKCQVTHRNQ
jgi:hypothetical protein